MKKTFWQFGETIPGYSIPVFNEREVRAAAGILFLVGATGYATVLFTGELRLLQGFAVLFLVDMYLRVFVTPRLSPTMALARIVVFRQRPEWVGAPPEAFGLEHRAWHGVALVCIAWLAWLASRRRAHALWALPRSTVPRNRFRYLRGL